MNWRLCTPAEIEASRVGRNRRRKDRQRTVRRAQTMERLVEIVGEPDRLGEIMQPKEAFDLTFRTLQKARGLEPLFRLRACRLWNCDDSDLPPATQPGETSHQTVGARVLHRSRRSGINPYLVPPVRPFDASGMPLHRVKQEAKKWKEGGFTVPQMIDSLHGFCGSWDEAAELALRLGLMRAPVSAAELQSIRCAREFWEHWHAGVQHYHAAVREALLPVKSGNWACIDYPGLIELLPGLQIPQAAVRDFYLLEMDGGFTQAGLRLILCSKSGTPLVIHPL